MVENYHIFLSCYSREKGICMSRYETMYFCPWVIKKFKNCAGMKGHWIKKEDAIGNPPLCPIHLIRVRTKSLSTSKFKIINYSFVDKLKRAFHVISS